MSKYVRGIGFVNYKTPSKFYLQNYFERDSITCKEYNYFKKKWYKLDEKHMLIIHKKSIIETILRKYNTNSTVRSPV